MKKIAFSLILVISSMGYGQVRLIVESIANFTQHPIQVLTVNQQEVAVIAPGQKQTIDKMYELGVLPAELNMYQLPSSGTQTGTKKRFIRFVSSFDLDTLKNTGTLVLLLQQIPLLDKPKEYFKITNDYPIKPLMLELERWVFKVKIEAHQDPQDSMIFFKREVIERR